MVSASDTYNNAASDAPKQRIDPYYPLDSDKVIEAIELGTRLFGRDSNSPEEYTMKRPNKQQDDQSSEESAKNNTDDLTISEANNLEERKIPEPDSSKPVPQNNTNTPPSDIKETTRNAEQAKPESKAIGTSGTQVEQNKEPILKANADSGKKVKPKKKPKKKVRIKIVETSSNAGNDQDKKVPVPGTNSTDSKALECEIQRLKKTVSEKLKTIVRKTHYNDLAVMPLTDEQIEQISAQLVTHRILGKFSSDTPEDRLIDDVTQTYMFEMTRANVGDLCLRDIRDKQSTPNTRPFNCSSLVQKQLYVLKDLEEQTPSTIEKNTLRDWCNLICYLELQRSSQD